MSLRDSQPWVVVGSPDEDALEFVETTEQVARLFTKQIGTHSSTDMLLAPATTEGDRGLSSSLSSSVPADVFSTSPLTDIDRNNDLSLSLPMLPLSSSGRKVSMLSAMEALSSSSGSVPNLPSRQAEVRQQKEEWSAEGAESAETLPQAVVFDEGRLREAGSLAKRDGQGERGAQSASWPGMEAPPNLGTAPLSKVQRRSDAEEAAKAALLRSLQEKDEALTQWQGRAVEAEAGLALAQAESGRWEALLQKANLEAFLDRRQIQMLQVENSRLTSLLSSFRAEPSVRSSFSPPPFSGAAFSRQWDVWQALQHAVTLELPSANAVAAAAAASATMQSGHCSTQDLDAILFMLLGGAAVAAFGFVFFHCTWKLGWITVHA
eukprot:TRINITY_DN313_c1_g1_i1.p1 TRINITY_DN313_c1_g1~~TRINITY_DN313_c1_g1_i1.p1  ORF type:complete len:378 (+),score=88.71 TRINITY_DN313_c1_g1_i1:266-1399(+)